MKYHARASRDMVLGDVLVTKKDAARLTKRLGTSSIPCHACAFDKVDCGPTGNDASIACGMSKRFIQVATTEEIENARDLFTLKGELK